MNDKMCYFYMEILSFVRFVKILPELKFYFHLYYCLLILSSAPYVEDVSI